MSSSIDEFRMQQMAEKAAKEAVREAFRLLGLYDDVTFNRLREAINWVESQRAGEAERATTLAWASEQRRRGLMIADTARNTAVIRLITGIAVVLTAAISGAIMAFLASKGIVKP